jgi:hypothetical protein
LTNLIKRIVILGGGSAGWLTAGILASGLGASRSGGVRITLVESPGVPPIGVGEGTWPSMRDTLRAIGVSESDFVRECDVSFKQASCFRRWVTGADDDEFFHPFAAPAGFGEIDMAAHWQSFFGSRPFADVVSYQPELIRRGKAPKQGTTPEWAAVANYAYHLDAGKFGLFLQRHVTEKLGVEHVLDHVTQVLSADNGDISALETAGSGRIEGDLFIDCTGFRSLLLGEHFSVPFRSCSEILFCDSAIAMQVPYPEEDSPIASATLSTAQKAGWIWDIGLPTRRGTGHVYSSSHMSADEAESILRSYASGSGTDADKLETRHISIRPGHRETFWHRNCAAIGIAAGFIEPLEASALAMIEMSAAMIRDDFPATRELMDIVSARFNQRLQYRWSRIVDFLKLHYLLSKRADSDFWLDNRSPETVPDRLLELMELWSYRPPSRRDFWEIEEIFPAASYQYVLYGMGARLETENGQEDALAERHVRETAGRTQKYIAGLPSNRQLLGQIASRGLPRI